MVTTPSSNLLPQQNTLTTPPATTSASINEDGAEPEVDRASAIAADFETFLTLLTTQLKAQDPLQPVESTQFVEQLATFSSVEQQLATNDKLDQLIEAVGGGGTGGELDSLGQWIDRDIEASVDAFRFDGEAVDFAAPQQNRYDGVTASVLNSNGDVIRTMNLSGDEPTYSWDGLTTDGARAPAGDYSIELTYRSSGQVPVTEAAPLTGKVVEVRQTEDGWRLQLENGRKVAIDDVIAARSNSSEQVLEENET
ncbi:MAG: flagellar hook capping FlgD N-terminal domain-containing protein [Pseudomonadota bacterium]